jgi:hypothetical protein
MEIVRLTSDVPGVGTVRLVKDHIVSYFTLAKQTHIEMANKGEFTVMETPEQIDQILAPPYVPDR